MSLALIFFFLALIAASANKPIFDESLSTISRAVTAEAEIRLRVSWYKIANNPNGTSSIEQEYINHYNTFYNETFEDDSSLGEQYLESSFSKLWINQVNTFMQNALEMIADVPGNTVAGLNGLYLRNCAQLLDDPFLFNPLDNVLLCSDVYECVGSNGLDTTAGNCNADKFGCVNFLSYVFNVTFVFPTDCPVGEYDPTISGFLVVKSPAELVTDILSGFEGGSLDQQYSSTSINGDGDFPYLVTYFIVTGQYVAQQPCDNGTCDVTLNSLHSVQFYLSEATSPQDLRNLPDPDDGGKDNSDNTAAIAGGVVGGVLGLLLLCLLCLCGPCIIIGIIVLVLLVIVVVICVILLLIVLILAIVMVIIGTLLRVFVYSKRKPPPDEAADLHGWSDHDSGSEDDNGSEGSDL